MTFVRIALGALLGILGIVVVVPAVVLVDLASGGTGLGLCPNGLRTCDAGAYAAAELIIVLAAIITVLAAGIAGCVYLLRRARRL